MVHVLLNFPVEFNPDTGADCRLKYPILARVVFGEKGSVSMLKNGG